MSVAVVTQKKKKMTSPVLSSSLTIYDIFFTATDTEIHKYDGVPSCCNYSYSILSVCI